MHEIMPQILYYYDKEVVRRICDKYGYAPMSALREFMFSKTYEMMINEELEMWEFSPIGIFDMWESEKETGDPRNSLYLRRE